MPRHKRHVYDLPVPVPTYQRLVSPWSAGAVGAATVALVYPRLPKYLDEFMGDCIGRVPILRSVPGVPRMWTSLLAFLGAYAAATGAGYARLVLLKKLLSWRGWMTHPSSLKTMLWGKLLQLLEGPGPFETFFFQPLMPKQPLPDLDQTLDTWLTVSEQFLSEDEARETREAVEEFRHGDGLKLQAYLQEKATTQVSWIYDYWIAAAYLSNRGTLAVNSNYNVANSVPPEMTTDAIARGTNTIWGFAKSFFLSAQFLMLLLLKDTLVLRSNIFEQHLVLRHITLTMLWRIRFAEHLRNSEIPPITVQNIVPMCMGTYKHLYNTNRLPGVNMDRLDYRPEGRNVVVIRKGQYFNIEMYAEDQKGKTTIISLHELQKQLKYIVAEADRWENEIGSRPPAVAALTGQARPTWAKNREILNQRNATSLDVIERCMFMAGLDDIVPKDVHEWRKVLLVGRGDDRWFDKCFTAVIFPNAWIGAHCEHSFADATIFSTACEMLPFVDQYENGQILPSSATLRNLPDPQKLVWDVTGLEDEIQQAVQELAGLSAAVDYNYITLPYGKGVMKKARVSPDGFIQMSLLYAYYLMHKTIPKAYEPATGRLFALGRTETIHPVSQNAVSWLRAMDDPTASDATKDKLFRAAVKSQTQFRLQATIGQGCDRHLLALMCASRELGMDMPKIFTDKAWRSPFKLSTSQTPNRLYEQNARGQFEWESVSGGFGPQCEDGYGACYMIHGDEIVNLNITSWKTCAETDSENYGKHVIKVMEDLRKLLRV